MKKYIVLTILAVTLFVGNAAAQSYKVIVNNANAQSSISKKELAMVFLKKRKRWEDGTVIAPIDQQAKASVRATFSEEIFRKKVSAIRSYWQSAMFSGMASAPDEKKSDQDVINYVKNNKGAIGYVSADSGLGGVKVLSIK